MKWYGLMMTVILAFAAAQAYENAQLKKAPLRSAMNRCADTPKIEAHQVGQEQTLVVTCKVQS